MNYIHSMNYYLIKRSSDIEEIGDTKQTIFKPPYNPTLPNTFKDIKVGGSIDFELRVPEFLLAPYAKITDFMRMASISYSTVKMISPRFLELLQNFQLADHQLFKTKVFDKTRGWDYYFFYFTQTFDEEYVDFEQSEFVITHISRIISPIEINSFEEFKEKRREVRNDSNTVDYISLVFKTEKIPYDFFRIYKTFYRGFFVSERLKEAIEAAGLTGMTFKLAGEIGPRD